MNEQQITAMATIMVQAREANEDVGELIAEALQVAAAQLGDVEMLIRGRPGSWEAEIIRRMVHAGGEFDNEEQVEALTALFVKLAEPRTDGGDALSQAMSKAVDKLGGLDAFSGGSEWHWDLVNMGRQYSSHWNDK